MFLLDREQNRIKSITSKTFSELSLTERTHLQEWIANESSSLGEDLLVIQKEYAGFTDTQERLDLLALDKDGNLVIIENKLDDTGREVVWQAIKYASYCLTLSTAQIVEIYQEYLGKQIGSEGDKEASKELCNFFEVDTLDEISLNALNRQRIIFVASNFRKEVTSAALWLLDQGINIRCIKTTPYCVESKIFINFEQIIPTPETADYIISRNSKESEEKRTNRTIKQNVAIRKSYWRVVLEAFQKSSCNLFNNINPTKEYWLSAGSGVKSCPYAIIFRKNEIRVELSLNKPSAAENKCFFDILIGKKSTIEEDFGAPLMWLRLDDKKVSRIQFSKSVEGYNSDNWDNFVQWHVEHMIKLEKATREHLLEAEKSRKMFLDVDL